MGAKHCPLTEPIFAHFLKISISAALRQIKPILVQNAFRMAPARLRTTLEQIPEHNKKITQNRPFVDANFQFCLSDFFDDMQDLRLSFRGNLAPSVDFQVSEDQVWESFKNYRT